jgi:hypothetical protein
MSSSKPYVATGPVASLRAPQRASNAAVAGTALGLRCELLRRIGLDAVWRVGQELTDSTPHLQATRAIEHSQNGIGRIGRIGAAVWRIGRILADIGRHRAMGCCICYYSLKKPYKV